MIDHQTPHRQAWLRTLQPRPILEDAAAAIIAALALLAAIFVL